MAFAILAVATNVFFIPIVNALEARGISAAQLFNVSEKDRLGAFEFLTNVPALVIMLAGLVNRLVSLMAGTAATLVLAVFFGQKPPKIQDWVSFGFILVAVAFLSRAEKKRLAEAGHHPPGGPQPR